MPEKDDASKSSLLPFGITVSRVGDHRQQTANVTGAPHDRYVPSSPKSLSQEFTNPLLTVLPNFDVTSKRKLVGVDVYGFP